MATTFTLNYSGQEINNKLAQVDTLATESLSKTDAAATYLAKSANNITYTQSSNGLTITASHGSLLLFPASSSSGDSSIFIGNAAGSPDKVYLLRNGIKYTTSAGANWVTVSYSNIATKTEVNAKQDTLVSGTNLATINGQNLLNGGNIQVAAEGGIENYEVIHRQLDWPVATATSPDFVEFEGQLYKKVEKSDTSGTILDLTGSTWDLSNAYGAENWNTIYGPETYNLDFDLVINWANGTTTAWEGHYFRSASSNGYEYDLAPSLNGSPNYIQFNKSTSRLTYYTGTFLNGYGSPFSAGDKIIVSVTGGAGATNAGIISWFKNKGSLISSSVKYYSYELVSIQYSSEAAVQGGTTESLVMTGEKYNWNAKQDALVSGTNIKTIDNTSILGSGNILESITNAEIEALFSEVTLISFTIGGVTIMTTYQAEQGMTWGEWVASQYNTDGFRKQGDYIVSSQDFIVTNFGGAEVNASDIISAGVTYYTTGGGSND